MEKMWSECSKEEKREVNKIAKSLKVMKEKYLNKSIREFEYYTFLEQALKELDHLEYFYSDNYQEFLEYKNNYESYNKVRDIL